MFLIFFLCFLKFCALRFIYILWNYKKHQQHQQQQLKNKNKKRNKKKPFFHTTKEYKSTRFADRAGFTINIVYSILYISYVFVIIKKGRNNIFITIEKWILNLGSSLLLRLTFFHFHSFFYRSPLLYSYIFVSDMDICCIYDSTYITHGATYSRRKWINEIV